MSSKAKTRAALRADHTTRPHGRPTKYDPRYCAEMLEYFEPAKALSVVERPLKGAPTLPAFPTLAGFAWKIGVHRDTLHQWAKEHPEFSDAYARAREAQEAILVTGGLHGAYNPTFATLTAKNVLGWRDKGETELSTRVGDPIADLMAAIADQGRARFEPPAVQAARQPESKRAPGSK